MSEIPGVPAAHAIITDECRENRGDDGAWFEAVDRLKRQYDLACQGWDQYRGVKLHVVLTVERPADAGGEREER